MPFFQRGDVRIRYEETGSGFAAHSSACAGRACRLRFCWRHAPYAPSQCQHSADAALTIPLDPLPGHSSGSSREPCGQSHAPGCQQTDQQQCSAWQAGPRASRAAGRQFSLAAYHALVQPRDPAEPDRGRDPPRHTAPARQNSFLASTARQRPPARAESANCAQSPDQPAANSRSPVSRSPVYPPGRRRARPIPLQPFAAKKLSPAARARTPPLGGRGWRRRRRFMLRLAPAHRLDFLLLAK
jgi:hypothetical protein